MILTNLSYLGMRFTDTVFAGQLGAGDLAGVSVGSDIWVAIFLFIMGLMLAVSPVVSHQYGAGENHRIGTTSRQAVWMALFASVPAVLLLINGEALLNLIGVDPRVIPKAGGYMDAVAWGLPAVSVYYVYRMTTEAVSHTRPLIVVALISLVLNAFLDWVFMWGNLGFPALGAVGTGYATAVVQWVMLIGLLFYMRRNPFYDAFQIFGRFEWPRWLPLRELLLLGLPISVSVFMEGSLFSATGLLMAKLGQEIVAGHTIAINWSALTFMIPLGLASGITVRVGQALGRRDPAGARFAGLTGVVLCTGFMVMSAGFMLLFHRSIVALYTADPVVTAVAISLLFVAAAFQIFDGLQVAMAGVLRGYKDTRVPMWMTVLAYWLLGMPVAILFGLVLDKGPASIWVGLIIGLAAASILLSLRFRVVLRLHASPR